VKGHKGAQILELTTDSESEDSSIFVTIVMPSLDDVPNELLEHILWETDAQTTTRCRQVSKRFNDLISTSISLQYKIELAMACLQDGPPGEMTISERLQALRTRRAAWASGKFTDDGTCNPKHRNWVFTGTHFAWMRDERRLEVM